MTQLLVSVRDADEATLALHAGADVIDVKEPARGSLGAADAPTIRSVISAVAGQAPVSAAFGELLEFDSGDGLPQIDGLAFAKLGLAGCGEVLDWPARWMAALDRLPRRAARVAVAYADWRAAGAPPPEEIARRAAVASCEVLLLDTFAKGNADLFDAMSSAEIGRLLALAEKGGLRTAIAGSLSLARLPSVLKLEPDWVAVRGAVCDTTRVGRLDPSRVGQWARAVRRPGEGDMLLAAGRANSVDD